MITGTYTDRAADARWTATMEKIDRDSRINGEVKAYFEALGYEVGWDHNRTGRWHEINHPKHGLACQIDHDVPLAHIVQDLSAMAGGAEQGTSLSDYTISAPPRHKPFEELCQRVAQNRMGGVQEQLPLS